jgi:HD domain
MKKVNRDLLDTVVSSLQEEAFDIALEQIVMDAFSDILSMIKDDELKKFISSIFYRVFTYKSMGGSAFWESPSSLDPSDHPPDEYENDGLLIHTRRTAKLAMCMGSAVSLPDDDMDILITAALLHDVTKAIYCNEEFEVTHDPLHIYTIDSFLHFMKSDDVKRASDSVSHTLNVPYEKLSKIVRMIHTSHGVWSPILETVPQTELERILAMANYVAENMHVLMPDLFRSFELKETDE